MHHCRKVQVFKCFPDKYVLCFLQTLNPGLLFACLLARCTSGTWFCLLPAVPPASVSFLKDNRKMNLLISGSPSGTIPPFEVLPENKFAHYQKSFRRHSSFPGLPKSNTAQSRMSLMAVLATSCIREGFVRSKKYTLPNDQINRGRLPAEKVYSLSARHVIISIRITELLYSVNQ